MRTGFARLRAFEFQSALSALDVRRPAAIVRGHRNRWERLGTGVGFSLAALIVLLWAAATRGPEVRWSGLDAVADLILHRPLAGYAVQLVGLVLSWLMWGLGGLMLLGATFGAGWGWRERALVRSAGESGRPLLELLPLTEAEVARAKLQGRLAGWLVLAAASVVVSFVATRLMVAFNVVNSVPPLVDPWLVAGFFGFLSFMALSRESAFMLRRRDQNAAAWRLALLCLGAGVAVGLGHLLGLVRFGSWNVASVMVLGWVGLSVARLVPYPPETADLAAAQARPSWLNGVVIPWLEGVFHVARVAMLPAVPAPAWGRRVWRLLPGALLATALIVGGGLLLEVLVRGGMVLWAAYTRVPLQIALAASGEGAFGVPVVLALVIFANLLIFTAWWPEFPPPQQGRRRRSPWVRLEMRHVGFLLPVAARRRWRQGLSAYLAAAVLVLPLGAGGFLLVLVAARRLSGFPLAGMGPRALVALPLGLLVGLMFHALAPLLRHASRVFGVNGCLLTLPLYSGLFVAELASVRLLETPGIARSLGLIMTAWAALLLGVSYGWIESRTWRRMADGAPAPGSRRRAVAVLVALFPTFGLVVGAIFAVMAYAAFGGR